MKTILMLMLAMPMLCATLTNETQLAILFSARQADMNEYFKATGAIIQDTPALDPRFTGLRVGMCNKKTWYFESTQVVLPCYATMADRVSWQPYSHMRQAQLGIDEFNAGKRMEGLALIDGNLAESVMLREN